MWAELTVQAKRDLPIAIEDVLKERFGPTADKRTTIDATVWRGDYSQEGRIVFARLSNSAAFLFYRPEARTLKVHIDNTYKKSKLKTLRRDIEQQATEIERFLKYCRNKANELKFVIWAEDDDFQTGTKLSLWSKIKKSVKEQVLTKIYVPIATYGLSVALSYEQEKALFNVLAAIGAVVLWVLIDAIFIMKSFEHVEE
jgi:hypothetical protein